jgi:hypothetical protein
LDVAGQFVCSVPTRAFQAEDLQAPALQSWAVTMRPCINHN